MILALPFLIGLAVGKLTGGSFRKLALTPVRGPWCFLLGFAIQLVLFTSLTDAQSWDLRWAPMLYIVSLLLLLAGLMINFRRLRAPMWILTAGAVLNFAVIVSNGGAMPAQRSLLTRWGGNTLVHQLSMHHIASNVNLAGPSTRLAFLGDDLMLPGQNTIVPISIGDLLIGLGGFLLVVREMNRGRQRSVRLVSISSGARILSNV